MLVQRVDNEKWVMPGGALEVGETPAEGVGREAWEETGVRCRPVALVGVFDSRLCGTIFRHHMYHFVFLCQAIEITHLGFGTHSHEVMQVAWFHEHELPDASEIDPGMFHAFLALSRIGVMVLAFSTENRRNH